MGDRVSSPDALLQALESVQFVVGRDGQPSGVFLDCAGWEALLSWLEDVQDRALTQRLLQKLRAGPVRSHVRRWLEVSAEWDDVPATRGRGGMSRVPALKNERQP